MTTMQLGEKVGREQCCGKFGVADYSTYIWEVTLISCTHSPARSLFVPGVEDTDLVKWDSCRTLRIVLGYDT
jgi:hypothetical protein